MFVEAITSHQFADDHSILGRIVNVFNLDRFAGVGVVRKAERPDPVEAAILQDLDHNGMDVIVDAGRLIACASPWPVVRASDALLLTARTTLPSMAGAKVWGSQLFGEFEATGMAAHLALLLVGEGRPFRAREVARVLQLPVVTTVAWDPAAAAVLSTGDAPPQAGVLQRLAGRGGWEDSALLRSYRAARSAIAGRIRINEEQLQAASGRQS